MGMMPATKLLLTDSDIVIGKFDNYSDIAYYLGIRVSDKGQVDLRGERVLPTYVMEEGMILSNHWKSKHDIIKDWASNYMIKNLPSSYRIYRYLK